MDYANINNHTLSALWHHVRQFLAATLPILILYALLGHILKGELAQVFSDGIMENIAFFTGAMGFMFAVSFSGLHGVIASSRKYITPILRYWAVHFANLAIGSFAIALSATIAVSGVHAFTIDFVEGIAILLLASFFCVAVILISHHIACSNYQLPDIPQFIASHRKLLCIGVTLIGITGAVSVVLESLSRLL